MKMAKVKEVKKKSVDAQTRKMNLAFLQLIFPVFLLALIACMFSSQLFPILLTVLVFGYEYIVLQSFVKSMMS
jgi:hypothetical protein